jgi:hypothetical protein
VAVRALLNIATRHVELALYDNAVVTPDAFWMPIITLLPVSNAREHLFPERVMGELLRSRDFSGPLLGHCEPAEPIFLVLLQSYLGLADGKAN